MKKILAIRHVKVEHAGLIGEICEENNIEIEYLDTFQGQTLKDRLEDYSLVLVLGGYMGAYEEGDYPFLSYEYRIMEQALKKEIPILGICLGSQMLAKVLGARVYKGDMGKEIGFFEVRKVGNSSMFNSFPEKLTVFQWHGDTFDLPKDAVRVFEGNVYQNQGFIYKNAIGLQFHIEVSVDMVKEWIDEYKDELLESGLNPEEMIKKAEIFIPLLETYLRDMFLRLLKQNG